MRIRHGVRPFGQRHVGSCRKHNFALESQLPNDSLRINLPYSRTHTTFDHVEVRHIISFFADRSGTPAPRRPRLTAREPVRVRTQDLLYAIVETGSCQRNTRKCRPQREHRQGWRSQWRVRSMTFCMPTVRKSIDLQRGHCARNSTSPATIMMESLPSARLCEERVVPVGLRQHA